MSYLDHQEQAKRATGSLIFYFTLGFLGVIASVTLAVLLLLIPITPLFPPPPGQWVYYEFRWILLGVTLLTASSMLVASWWKMGQLRRGGGEAIAKTLGGRLVLDTPNLPPLERRLRNVVEEMAIASETHTPLIYILDKEPGLNAFAAGLSSHQAVLGITKGAVQLLRRDELQALVAHEFSHIKSGDMRLNLRLMGLLHGILFLALSGQFMLKSPSNTHIGSGSDGGNPFAPIAAFLVVIGSLGGLCGKLLKAGVSRQREFLADASAVQFTRNPQALINVLLTVGGCERGSSLNSPRAAEASHMFFADGLNTWLSRKLATHPTLEERIRRIDPMYTGPLPRERSVDEQQLRETVLQQAQAEVAGFAGLRASSLPGAPRDTQSPPTLIEERSLRHARRLLQRLPPDILLAARNSAQAPAVLCAILLARATAAQRRIMDQVLLENSGIQFHDTVQRQADELSQAPKAVLLPLLDLTVPGLQALPPEQRQSCLELVRNMMRSDKKINLFEWMLENILTRHLADAAVQEAAPPTMEGNRLENHIEKCSLLLSAMAQWGAQPGHNQDAEIQQAYAAGTALLDFPLPAAVRQEPLGLREVDAALRKLAKLSPASREKLLAALTGCVRADCQVSQAQAELLRGAAALLVLPMPPLLPGQLLEPVDGEDPRSS